MKRFILALAMLAVLAFPDMGFGCPPPPAPDYDGPGCGDGPDDDDDDCVPPRPRGEDVVTGDVVI